MTGGMTGRETGEGADATGGKPVENGGKPEATPAIGGITGRKTGGLTGGTK